MRKCSVFRGVLFFILCLAVAMVLGCGKRPVVKEEAGVAVTEPAKEKAEAAKEEAAIQEELLKGKEKQEKERILKEAASFADVYFDFDQYDLTAPARETLKQHADWLLANPAFDLLVEGHCDERGTAEYNLALGERRANAAKDYLAGLGVDARRITTISYGEELPVDAGHDEAAWTKNRRAHFVVTPRSK
jgi:peptidoglycan-associated lipoprotein